MSASSLSAPIDAVVYYVSENGDDSNDGSESSPFKTIDKVNEVLASSAEKTIVNFKRDDVFRGNLVARSNVTFSAYGAGDKPIISGSPENGADSDNWELVSGTDNIWRYKTKLRDIGSIFFDNNKTYAVKQCPSIKDGAYTFGYESLDNLQFFCDLPCEEAINIGVNREVKGDLYLRCDEGNPGSIYSLIEFSDRRYAVSVPEHSSDIIIDNLCIKYSGAHGIGGSNINNLTVQNCEVAYIGGGIMKYSFDTNTNTYIPTRYGNGIEVNTGCNGYTVQNCWVHDIYDAGVTFQVGENYSGNVTFNNVKIKNNLIENCTYSVEYFAASSSTGNATINNVVVSDNIMRNAGSGFGSQRTLLVFNMSAHIMGWYKNPNIATNFVIKNNIFDRVIYSDLSGGSKINSSCVLVSAEKSEYLPVFSRNTYIQYNGSQFCYYGENVTTGFNADYFTTAITNTNIAESLGDTTGRFEAVAQISQDISEEISEKTMYLNNTYHKLADSKELSVAYIGGSVTSGYGSSDADNLSWRGLTTNWLKENYQDAEITAINGAIGSTGSYSAVFRYEREIAPKSPDLLFLEFAINDFYDNITYDQALRDAESIVRTVYKKNPYADIVVVLTADKWRSTYEYDTYRALRDVANHYNLLCVDIRKDFLMKLSDSEYFDYMRSSSDGVHPNDAGYQKYFELVKEKLQNYIVFGKQKNTTLKAVELPKSIISFDELMTNADSIKPEEMILESNNGWTVENQSFSTIGFRGYSSIIKATNPGSEFSFKFTGTDLGLFINKNENCGKISVTIDSNNPVIIDSYQANQNHSAVICGWNLNKGEHTVTVVLQNEKNSSSSGNEFTIGAFLVN